MNNAAVTVGDNHGHPLLTHLTHRDKLQVSYAIGGFA